MAKQAPAQDRDRAVRDPRVRPHGGLSPTILPACQAPGRANLAATDAGTGVGVVRLRLVIGGERLLEPFDRDAAVVDEEPDLSWVIFLGPRMSKPALMIVVVYLMVVARSLSGSIFSMLISPVGFVRRFVGFIFVRTLGMRSGGLGRAPDRVGRGDLGRGGLGGRFWTGLRLMALRYRWRSDTLLVGYILDEVPVAIGRSWLSASTGCASRQIAADANERGAIVLVDHLKAKFVVAAPLAELSVVFIASRAMTIASAAFCTPSIHCVLPCAI